MGEGEFGRLRGDSHRLPPPRLGVAAAWELWGGPCYFQILSNSFKISPKIDANLNLLVPEADQTGKPS